MSEVTPPLFLTTMFAAVGVVTAADVEGGAFASSPLFLLFLCLPGGRTHCACRRIMLDVVLENRTLVECSSGSSSILNYVSPLVYA